MHRLAALVVTVVVVAAAGCGIRSDAGGVEVAATAEFLAASAERTSEAGTGRFELVVEMSGLPAIDADEIRIAGEGAYDTDADRASITLDLSAFADIIGAGGDGEDEEAAEAFAQPIETVVDGTVVYLRFPLLAATAGSDASWVRLDVAEAEATGGVPVSPSSVDPRALLDFLYGVAGGVEEVGTEDVRDVATTHLRAEVTPDDIAGAVPEADRARVEAMLDALVAADVPAFPLDVWVDAQGRVRRVQAAYEVPASATGAAEDLTTSLTVDYFAFGEDVAIEVPAGDDVVDGTELFGGGSGD